MARLFTDHDPFHLHAGLGLLALVQFAYRWWLILTTGTAFAADESLSCKLATLSIHIWLPLASLVLPVPRKRNLERPMIWPEFRWHSLLFSTRHVVVCMLSCVYLEHLQNKTRINGDDTPSPSIRLYLILAVAVWNQIIMAAASLVTQRLGSTTQRTTNAMPYPAGMGLMKIQTTRDFYRGSQFLATAMAHAALHPTLAYMPLLAIQIAPLCMTLVRKSLLSPQWHHCAYAWALWWNLPGMVVVMLTQKEGWRHVMWCFLAYWFSVRLRIVYEWNKHAAWWVGPLLAHTVLQACHAVSPLLHEWMPLLTCPRVVWLVLKSSRAALDVAWQNQHVLLPGVFDLEGKTNQQGNIFGSIALPSIEKAIPGVSWMLGVLCNVVFAAGVALSLVMFVVGAVTSKTGTTF